MVSASLSLVESSPKRPSVSFDSWYQLKSEQYCKHPDHSQASTVVQPCAGDVFTKILGRRIFDLRRAARQCRLAPLTFVQGPGSLTTLRTLLSSRSPANFECRRRSDSVHSKNSAVPQAVAEPKRISSYPPQSSRRPNALRVLQADSQTGSPALPMVAASRILVSVWQARIRS